MYYELPYEGKFRVIVLYLDKNVYSDLSIINLKDCMTPNIYGTRDMRFHDIIVGPKCFKRVIDSK